jgi:hypothetical protein
MYALTQRALGLIVCGMRGEAANSSQRRDCGAEPGIDIGYGLSRHRGILIEDVEVDGMNRHARGRASPTRGKRYRRCRQHGLVAFWSAAGRGNVRWGNYWADTRTSVLAEDL